MSSATAIFPAVPAMPRGLLLLALLSSAWVFAQTAKNLDPSATIDELQKQEILSSTEDDWRRPEVVEEDEWRQPDEKIKPVQRSRMQFGYESIYDEARIRRDDPVSTYSPDLEKYKPSTMFKVTF
ncbi:MAG: hypothetical protein HKN81_03410 [Gammaproteobacteria bacterium]|nr:hypothetical protein [Gammaproteobacteria bacterium]NND36162.1 hypothetical protein [Gammaproteobacteria bacterium]